jgi:hypothetical protein
MSTPRSTAVVEFNLPSSAMAESLPLTSEREFGICLHIDGQERPAGLFRSPINDAQWRDFSRWLAKCNSERDPNNYQQAQAIRNCGRDLYRTLAALSTDLAGFLAQTGTPRRLVIQTTRPELHQLPWAALYDSDLSLLAAGDLSIVQTWGAVYDSNGRLLEASAAPSTSCRSSAPTRRRALSARSPVCRPKSPASRQVRWTFSTSNSTATTSSTRSVTRLP